MKSIRFFHHNEIRAILGLNPSKLPSHGGEWCVGGLHFLLKPATQGPRYPYRGRREHRLLVECPTCNRWMSVGRWNQHQSAHPLSDLSRMYLDLPYGFWKTGNVTPVTLTHPGLTC